MNKGEKDENPLTKEDIDAMNKDIADAKSSLVSKETEMKLEDVKRQAKEEAKQELELKAKFEQQEQLNKELQEKLEAKEREASERLSKLQEKVDEMVSSKAAVRPVDPFAAQEQEKAVDLKRMSDEDINDLEHASAQAFFGSELDDRN